MNHVHVVISYDRYYLDWSFNQITIDWNVNEYDLSRDTSLISTEIKKNPYNFFFYGNNLFPYYNINIL